MQQAYEQESVSLFPLSFLLVILLHPLIQSIPHLHSHLAFCWFRMACCSFLFIT